MLDTLWSDARTAFRAMRAQPTMTVVAAVTLALGLSVNTSIFAIATAVLDPELPYGAADRVVVAHARNPAAGIPRGNMTGIEVAAWTPRPAFDALGAYEFTDFNFAVLSSGSEPERVAGALASAGVFEVLGITPATGRLFTPADDRPGGERVAVISHALWARRFASSPSAVGSTVMLHGQAYTVVGVLPERFVLGGADVWVPLAMDARRASSSRRSLTVLGRLAPGRSLHYAQAQLAAVSRRVADSSPDAFRGWTVDVVPLREWVVGQRSQVLRVLRVAVFVVLLIACSNIANVQLARAAARRRELSLRVALGAGRARIVRHLLTEGLLLSLIGAALALLFALGEVRLARGALPGDVPSWVTFRLDGAALGFTLLLAVGTAVLFGLAPALHASRADPGHVLHEDSRTTSGSRRLGRARATLLAGQLALAMTLFAIAAGLVRFSLQLERADPGFDASGAVSVRLTLPESTYPTDDLVRLFHRTLLDRLRSIPQVRAAALTTDLPAVDGAALVPARVEGGAGPGRDSAALVLSRSVSREYFDVLSVRRLSGTPFSASDLESGPVVVINEAMARRVFPTGDAMGRLVTLGADSTVVRARIVGVVRDTSGIEEGSTAWQIYRPIEQAPSRTVVVVGKAAGDIAPVVKEMRRVIHELDPLLPLYAVRSLPDAVRRQVWAPRAFGFVLGVLASLALGLSMLGVYGAAAYAAAQRRREIGIRVALGARSRSVVLLFVRHSMRLAGVGMVVGAVGALAGSRVLAARLGVPGLNAVVLLGTALVLGAAAAAATYFPSRRASRVDPLVTLRGD